MDVRFITILDPKEVASKISKSIRHRGIETTSDIE